MERKPTLQRLPDAELRVMRVLWDAAPPVPRSYVGERLAQRQWSVSTLNSLLSRLTKRGFISCERQGQSCFYAPLVQEEDYRRVENDALLERLYGNSIRELVASFCRTRKLRPEEIDDLQTLLDSYKQEES